MDREKEIRKLTQGLYGLIVASFISGEKDMYRIHYVSFFSQRTSIEHEKQAISLLFNDEEFKSNLPVPVEECAAFIKNGEELVNIIINTNIKIDSLSEIIERLREDELQ